MNKVLIVVDMQKDFVDGALGTKEAESIVDSVVEKILSHDGYILVTRDTHQSDYMDTQEGKNLPVIHCVENTPGWQLNAKVAKALEGKEYQIINKPTFGSTRLAHILSEMAAEGKVSEIEFVGLCTGICVISNTLLAKATLPEVPISVDANCCACVTPDSHRTALDAMSLCQIAITE